MKSEARLLPAGGLGPELEEIYAPIRGDLEELDFFLAEHFRSGEPFIHQLLAHIARFRGKQIRPALLLLVGRLASGISATGAITPGVVSTGEMYPGAMSPGAIYPGGVSPAHVKIAAVIELIHTATLVHDDILDDAALRRNVETLHRRWGERAAVLIGDYLYSRAFSLSTQVPGMAEVLASTTNTICEGELLQIGNRFRPEMGEAVYFEIIRKKTAILYAVAGSLGARLSGVPARTAERLHDFGMDLGMAFQIIDDCLDYSGDEARTGKSLGTDLHQGKATLPLIYLIESLEGPRAAELVQTLKRPVDRETEERIAAQVRDEGALQDALDRARSFVDSARGHLAGLPPPLRERLGQVAEYVIRRQR